MVNKIKKIFIFHSADYVTVSKLRNEIDELLINGNIYVLSSENMVKKLAELAIPISIDPMAYSLQSKIKDQLNTKELEDETIEYSVKPSLIKLFENFGLNTSYLKTISSSELKKDTRTFFDVFESEINWDNFISCIQSNFTEKRYISSVSDSILLTEIHAQQSNKIISPTLVIYSEKELIINKRIAASFDTILILISKDKKFNESLTIDFLKYCINHSKKIMFWFEPGVNNDVFLDLVAKAPDVKFSVKFAGYDMLVKAQKKSLNIDAIISAFGYGDERRILPVGGGIPVNKVYDTDLHERVSFSKYYEKIVDNKIKSPDDYLIKICGCEQCRNLFRIENTIDAIFRYSRHTIYRRGLRKFAMATSAAQSISTMHYLYNRIKEINSYNDGTELNLDTNLWKL